MDDTLHCSRRGDGLIESGLEAVLDERRSQALVINRGVPVEPAGTRVGGQMWLEELHGVCGTLQALRMH